MELVRKWVQFLFVFLVNGYWAFPFTRTIYQGPLKIICSPGLNCYSCPAATTYCPLGSLQQLFGAIRVNLANGQYFFGLSVVGSMGLLGAAFGRLICGWACPFGFFQELLHKIPGRKFSIPKFLNYFKYFFLAFFVVLLPLLVVDQFGYGAPWFCKFVCPAGTLEAGIPMLLLQPDLRNSLSMLFYSKFVILLVFVAWSVLASRPFCRTTCPLGAFYALFRRAKAVRLQLVAANCTNCKACHGVCPMGVRFNESPDDAECISCMRCMQEACRYDAIRLEIAGLPLGRGLRQKAASAPAAASE